MPTWLAAGLWGLVGGAALVLGAAMAWWVRVPQKVVAGVMAFGAGVLISALAFELVDEAVRQGGAVATAVGFLVGAVVYVGANPALDRRGARHRKRSTGRQPSADEQSGSGAAIAVGALLDGVSPTVVAAITAVAAGAILAMLADTMIPEAFQEAHALTGLITAVGFLTALAVHLTGG